MYYIVFLFFFIDNNFSFLEMEKGEGYVKKSINQSIILVYMLSQTHNIQRQLSLLLLSLSFIIYYFSNIYVT